MNKSYVEEKIDFLELQINCLMLKVDKICELLEKQSESLYHIARYDDFQFKAYKQMEKKRCQKNM